MVNEYLYNVKFVVEYKISINMYELIKDIGLCCIYFNWIVCEGVCG